MNCDRVSFDNNLGPLILTSCTQEVRVLQISLPFLISKRKNFTDFVSFYKEVFLAIASHIEEAG